VSLSGRPAVPALERALSLYRGPFLAGLSVRDSSNSNLGHMAGEGGVALIVGEAGSGEMALLVNSRDRRAGRMGI
jgi:hypothetical protein